MSSPYLFVWVCMCAFIVFFFAFSSLSVYMHVAVCLHDEVPGNELIGHMSPQMSSLFNKAGELNCHYCQHLTVALPARWYFVIYHSDELSQITLYSLHDESNSRVENSPVFSQIHLKYCLDLFQISSSALFRFEPHMIPIPKVFLGLYTLHITMFFTKHAAGLLKT